MRMPFSGKIERAQEFSREQSELREKRARFGDDVTPGDLMEKGDGCAMLIAAFITIVPVCLVVIGILAAAGYFIIVR